MAAGIGSRFGEGIKQLTKVDKNNHIIIDYSIHDAIEAGFNKVVFVIRRDIEEEFKEVIGNRIKDICSKYNVKVEYAYQDINNIPAILPKGRVKPWGTGQAVLAAKEFLTEPFVVINADDYYGKEAFNVMHKWICKDHKENEFCMAGFYLKNTLSENGGVTRGICTVKDGYLVNVNETQNIIKTKNGANSNGVDIDIDSTVSMNMWGLNPEFIPILEQNFKVFFEVEVPKNPLKSEYLLPIIIDKLLKEKKVTVKVLESRDKWFGVTYKEDKQIVIDEFKRLINNNIYQVNLYSDLALSL